MLNNFVFYYNYIRETIFFKGAFRKKRGTEDFFHFAQKCLSFFVEKREVRIMLPKCLDTGEDQGILLILEWYVTFHIVCLICAGIFSWQKMKRFTRKGANP